MDVASTHLVPIQAEVTAYAPNSAICQTTNITFDGTNTDHRTYALAANKAVAIGAVIYIPANEGVLDKVRAFDRGFIVDDRGGDLDTAASKRPDRIHLDLRVKDVNYAKAFGRRIITVYVEAKYLKGTSYATR